MKSYLKMITFGDWQDNNMEIFYEDCGIEDIDAQDIDD